MTPFKPLPIRTPVFKTGQRVAEAGSDQRFGTVLSITDAAHPVVEVRWDDLPERPTVHRPHSLRRAPRWE